MNNISESNSSNLLVSEFQRLIAFLKEETDKYRSSKNIKKVKQNTFRIRQLSNVLYILKKYPKTINLNNYKELDDISGIGKGSIKRIKEILEKGKLSELGDFTTSNNVKKEKNKSINELEQVVGIGRARALELYEKGVKSIKMLKTKIKNKEIEVNDKIILGLKYHGVYETNIPRKEVTKYYKIIINIIKKINKKLDNNSSNEYIFEICGSYRREKLVSNDIDVLITKCGVKNKTDKHLKRIIKQMKKNIKKNNDKPLLVDDMTDKKVSTKYMGFSQHKDNPIRRIDIRFVPYDSYYSALLYFTGSRDFNKKMRKIAKDKGYKLSEYGLFDKDDNKIKVKSERGIFKKLDMEYLPPRLR